MTTYTRIQESKYTTYIIFDDDINDLDWFKKVMGITDSVDTEVTVDPNNCVRYYTFDNEDSDRPDSIDGHSYYEFANEEDADAWLEYNNSDGHQNNLFAYTVVINGVERTEYVDD